MFDLNDFDETLPGPWEWDVKRLAVSMEVAGRDNGYSDKERRAIVLETVAGYRNAMRGFAGMRALDVWYARLEVDELMAPDPQARSRRRSVKRAEKTLAKARTQRQHDRLLEADADGGRRAADRGRSAADRTRRGPAPATSTARRWWRRCTSCMRQYRESLQTDRRILLEEFGWSTSPARWSGSEASAPAPGSR